MSTIEIMTFGSGIVFGSLLLLSVSIVWIRNQRFGIGGSVMCVCGVALVGLTVWRTIQLDITKDGISGRFERAERGIAQLNRSVAAVDSTLETMRMTNAEFLRDVGVLSQSVTSTSEQFRAFAGEFASGRSVSPNRAATFRDSVVVPQFDASVFEERAQRLEQSR